MAKNDKVKPYQLLHDELFYPTRNDIQQTFHLTCQLTCEAATIFLVEFRDPSKATSDYLSCMKGSKSWDIVSEQTKALSLHVLASNSVSEANHAYSTVGLKLSGTIHLNHVCAEGQTMHNNDFGCDHEVLVRGKGSSGKSLIRNLGTYHNLCNELKSLIIQAAQENDNATQKKV
jgi:hypothetical protein